MKKNIKKQVSKVGEYAWKYAKMSGLFPEFKNKKKESK